MFDEEHVIYRYKYLPYSDGSLKTLTEGTIKFTCPLEFNDPFDCRPYFDTENIDHVPRIRPDLYKKAGTRRGLSPAERIQEKGKFVARLRKRVEDGRFAREIISRVGVVSLSKNALSIPMWSHYADFHRGFVLEFRIPIMGYEEDIPLTYERLLPFPIVYQSERPRIEIGVDMQDELVRKSILTKSIDWEYEEEERVVDHERGPGKHPYRRDEVLCSVIAGMDADSRHYNNLSSIVRELEQCSQLNISLFKANEIKDEYKIIVNNHPRLDNA